MRALASSAAVRDSVVAADPRHDPLWRTLAEGPGGSLFVSPPWIEAVCDSYPGLRPEARILLDFDGRPRAGFAWIGIDDIRGSRLSSLPFSDRAEPIAPDLPTWERLSAEPLATGRPLTVRCLGDSAAVGDPRFHVVGEAAWHGLSLEGTADDVLGRASGETRRNIRAAGRGGLRAEVRDDLEAVRQFHGLHVALRKRKYRLLAQPVGFFERIWETFAPQNAILTVLAFDGDEPIAGALYLVWNNVLYYKFGASLTDRLSLRPNELVHWTAIRWAIERGLRDLDWGLSDLDQPGLLRFKRKWGSREGRIVTLRAGDARPSAAAAEFVGVLGCMTELLTDDAVPDEVAARAGAAVYRYFS